MTRWQKFQFLLVIAVIGFGAYESGVLPFFVIGAVAIFAGVLVYRRFKPEPVPPPPPKTDVIDLESGDYEFLNKDGQWETHVPPPEGLGVVGNKMWWAGAMLIVGLGVKVLKGL